MLALHCCKFYPMAKLRAMNWCCIMPCNVQVLAAECCKYRAILRQILRSLEMLTANGQHMVHRYFHTEVLSQRHVFTQAFTHTHAFTQGWFYAQIPSCAGVFTQGCFYTKKTFTPKRVGTSTRRCLYTTMLLQRSAFTRTCFYTELILTQISFYTHRRFYIKYYYAEMFFTQKNICTKASFQAHTLLQRGFLHGYFYGEMFFNTGAFT